MATFTTTAEVEVDLNDFEDDEMCYHLEMHGYTIYGPGESIDCDLDSFMNYEIVDYLEDQGYTVYDPEDNGMDKDMSHAIWEYKFGSLLEAVKLIELAYPELKGLSEKFV